MSSAPFGSTPSPGRRWRVRLAKPPTRPQRAPPGGLPQARVGPASSHAGQPHCAVLRPSRARSRRGHTAATGSSRSRTPRETGPDRRSYRPKFFSSADAGGHGRSSLWAPDEAPSSTVPLGVTSFDRRGRCGATTPTLHIWGLVARDWFPVSGSPLLPVGKEYFRHSAYPHSSSFGLVASSGAAGQRTSLAAVSFALGTRRRLLIGN